MLKKYNQHPECSHCQHVVEIQDSAPRPKPTTPEEHVMYVCEMYSDRKLTRNQIRSATGLNVRQLEDALEMLVKDQKIAYSGSGIKARGAKFKLFGTTIRS